MALKDVRFRSVELEAAFFSLKAFPVLKVLSVSAEIEPLVTPSSSLLDALDMVQVQPGSVTTIPSVFFECDTPVLLTPPFLATPNWNSPSVEHTASKHLRIIAPPLGSNVWLDRQLMLDLSSFDEWDAGLFSQYILVLSSPSKPVSIHLPLLWRTPPSSTPAYIISATNALVEACRENAVDVVWYRDGAEGEHLVSKEFWEYAKRIKADRERT